ncbi:mannitol dehydrogenase family protein [Paenarthrobacter sp. NPDC089714]|uniref:mannitol dehydrogenase family protein n=1 Tax=Paenarthrobacter sp. NPDC089714 TaxID=3364377 RepID=UPI00381E1229
MSGLLRRTAPAAPVRIVHLGLGAFHRSHQAWYTQHAGDAGEWGIASFTGRRPDAATVLAAQDGLFTVVERSDSGDSFEVVGSIVEAVDGADVARFVELLAAPSTAVVTLTITEAAYGLGAADLSVLLAGGEPTTPMGRLVAGLAARRASDAGPLAVVSCDNLSDNGNVARNGVLSLAREFDAGLAAWIEANVSFVSTSVDRITPRTTASDISAVAAACGYQDEAPVVTEPFHNWVLSGAFPAGRPRWEDAGAVFVDDIEPYENRKLWLLNGAHSILAYAGQLRGHTTVSEALADPVCRDAVEEFWDEASKHLPGEELRITEYRAALLERFGNSRIAHHLAQIALDGSTKLRMRAIPVLRAERADGRTGRAAARMIAVWSAFLAVQPGLQDPLSDAVAQASLLSGQARTAALLALLDAELAKDAGVVSLIHELGEAFAAVPAEAGSGTAA